MKWIAVIWTVLVGLLVWTSRVEATPKPPVSESAYCCCNTANGVCCNEMAYCGSFIPGCMCKL